MTGADQARVEALHFAYWAWRGRALGASVRRERGLVAICAAHIVESWYVNRVLVTGSMPAGALQAVVNDCRRSGCAVRVEATERVAASVDALRELGEPTERSRIMCVALTTGTVLPSVPPLRVVAVNGSEHCAVFWDAYRRFFEDETLDTDTRARLSDSLRRSTWIRAYMTQDGNDVVGVGLLGLRHRIALLADAATAPWARRRGVYQALVAARIQDAVAAGATVATSDLEPGGGSDRVLTRLGLTGGYRRLAWVLAPINGARQPLDASMRPPIEPGA